MSEPSDPGGTEDGLLEALAAHFERTDPVPETVLDGARAAFAFRDLDAQLAELLRDSALEDKALAGVRGTGQRLLSFGVEDRFLEVDVQADGERREITGYVVPAGVGRLEIEAPGGTVEAEVDEGGRFRFEGLMRGPIRLLFRSPGLPALATPWLAI